MTYNRPRYVCQLTYRGPVVCLVAWGPRSRAVTCAEGPELPLGARRDSPLPTALVRVPLHPRAGGSLPPTRNGQGSTTGPAEPLLGRSRAVQPSPGSAPFGG